MHTAIQYLCQIPWQFPGRQMSLSSHLDLSHKNPYYCQRVWQTTTNILLMLRTHISVFINKPLLQSSYWHCKGRKLIPTYESSPSTEKADHIIVLFLLEEKRAWKCTGRHQNNVLNAGQCSWQQSLQNTLGNLLWQGFMCPVPCITMTLFTLPYNTPPPHPTIFKKKMTIPLQQTLLEVISKKSTK